MNTNVKANDFLREVRQHLRVPVEQIVRHSEKLVEEATSQGRKRFLADLQKIYSAGKQLVNLVFNEVLDENKDLGEVRHQVFIRMYNDFPERTHQV